jgi:DnaJ-class molecular chaperone
VADYYELLGLPKTATTDEIRAAFRMVSKDLHPDRNPSEEAAGDYRLVIEAFEILSNDEARQAYDDALQGRTRRGITLRDILQGVGSVAGIFMEAVARSQVLRGEHPHQAAIGGLCPVCRGSGAIVVDLKIIQLTKVCETCAGSGSLRVPAQISEEK